MHNDAAIETAVEKFCEFILLREWEIDVDSFEDISEGFLDEQGKVYLEGEGYRQFSMLTIAIL